MFLFPVLQSSLGLRGTLLLTAGIALLGALLTLVLPEPAGRSLEEISGESEVIAAAEQAIRVPGGTSPGRMSQPVNGLAATLSDVDGVGAVVLNDADPVGG